MQTSYYELMTDKDLLEIVSDPLHLDGYRKQCKQILLARLEAREEVLKL